MNDVKRAETDAVATGYKAVGEAKQAIDARLNKIRGELGGLGSSWKGDAATAFHSLMTEFDTAAQRLQGVLSGLDESLRGVDKINVQQEAEATDSAGRADGGALAF
ncbi:MAG: WXG100 family type VII secretion target [Micrococcales bacterium]|nr:WXG100 family type VII secretion target [Micrococcales bacterium]